MSTQLPKKPKRSAHTFLVLVDLYERVRAHCKTRNISIREAVEYGLQKFAEECERESQLDLFNNKT